MKSAPAMTSAQIEQPRVAAVKRYDILDTPQDGAFDRITAIAARRFDVPIAIISVVDEDRIWFKSHHGLDINQIDKGPGLCASAILSNEPHILQNAEIDPRSLANPLVAGEFGLRFYAGVPLQTRDGHNLGTLCVIDKKPRSVTPEEIDDLKDLAAVVMDQLELRLSAREAVAQAKLMAREIDHRVMNSLQFVSGLLAMQSRQSDTASAVDQLEAAANRVAAVARVHQHFYIEEAAETVSCITFLRRLCADLSGILGRPIAVDGAGGSVPTSQIQSIGLIVNELVTNAAKHGAGEIRVTYQTATELQEIIVCDEGEGFPVSFDPYELGGSLGMKVITTLADQLGGGVTAKNLPTGGSCFVVAFPY